MGVLDDIRDSLTGQTTERVVPTDIPEGTLSSMDKLGIKLEIERRQKEALAKVAKTKERDDYIRAHGGAPVAPLEGMTSDRADLVMPPPGFGPPRMGPIAIEKVEQDPAYRAEQLRKSQGATIGPATPQEMNPPALEDMGYSEGMLAGRRAAQEDGWESVGKLAVVGQFVDRLLGSTQVGATRTAQALAKGTDSLSRLTGLSKGGLFDRWAEDSSFLADYFKAKSGKTPGSNQKALPEALEMTADIGGQLAWDLPQIMAMGPYGLAMHGAAYGLAEGGVEGMVKGAITGALTHGVIQGIGMLPTAWRIPTAAGFGGLTAWAGGEDPKQILASAATWGVLTGKGGKPVTTREFVERYPHVIAGVKGYQASRAVQKLTTTGITREEFLYRWPEMKRMMNDDMAENMILNLNANATPEDIRAAGGGMKVLEQIMAPVDQAMAAETQKITTFRDSVLHFAKNMDAETLLQRQLQYKLELEDPKIADPENTPQRSIMVKALGEEIKARGLQEIQSPGEYHATKTDAEWMDIYGLQPMYMDPKWYWILKQQGQVPPGVEPPPGAERYQPASVKLRESPETVERQSFRYDEAGNRVDLGPVQVPNIKPGTLEYERLRRIEQGGDMQPGMRASKNPRVDKRGYVSVQAPLEQGQREPMGPFGIPEGEATGRAMNGMIPEGRLRLQQKLGRELGPDEIAHHKNLTPFDNRSGNLYAFKDREAHNQYHASADARRLEIEAADRALESAPDSRLYLEDTVTGEYGPVAEGTEPGPGEITFRVFKNKQADGRLREVDLIGDGVEPWIQRRASGGRINSEAEGHAEWDIPLPNGELLRAPKDIMRNHKTGEVRYDAQVSDPNGNIFTRGFKLNAEEAAEFNRIDQLTGMEYNKAMGQLIDTVESRLRMDRPAGGVPERELKPGELSVREQAEADDPKMAETQAKIRTLEAKINAQDPRGGYKYSLTQREKWEAQVEALKSGRSAEPGVEYVVSSVRPPFSDRIATGPDEPLGDGEFLLKRVKGAEDEVLKRADDVSQRELDEVIEPKAVEPPRGTIPYPKDLLLHGDFKSREQATVRDVYEGHKANGASTVNPYDGDMAGKDLWAVSLYPERTYIKEGKDLSEAEIYNFWRKNADLLSSDPRLNIGTWFNAEDGNTYVDVSLLLPKSDAALAEKLGRQYNQIAVTLLDKEYQFPTVKTGGTGKVLKDAGWAPEGERLNDLYATGEDVTLYHYGNTPEVNPHAMGRGQMGEEGEQFVEGTDRLKYGNRLKSNFYTPESKSIEAHRWGGMPVGKGKVDKGQLFDASTATTGNLDQEAVRAGKRGWYDPATGQVRLFTTTQVERLGRAMFGGQLDKLTGRDVEKNLVPDNPTLVEDPKAPAEDYGKSEFFRDKGVRGRERGSVLVSGQEVSDLISRMRFLLFDKFAPIHQLTKMLEDAGIDVPVMQNPSYMVKLLGGLSGRAEAKVFYKRFTTDADGNIMFNGKSLKDIYAPHKGDMAGLDDFLTARRALEIEKNNASKATKDKVDVGIDLNWAKQIVANGQAKYGASAQEFTSYFHGLLDELSDSGLVSKDLIKQWKTDSPNYAPMRVDLETIASHLDAASGTNSAKQTLDRVLNPVRKLRGSKADKIPPTQAAVMMTYEITSAVERNRAAQAIVNLRNLSPEMAKLIHSTRPKITYVRDITTGKDVPTIGRQESDTVSVSFDGKRQFFKVPEDVAQSMKLICETGLGRWVKLMAIPARTLRTGATAAPEFAFRNPLRDWMTAAMNAKYGFNPITDFGRGLFTLIMKENAPDWAYKVTKTAPESYWKWKASGGEWSMLVSLDKALGAESVKAMHRETDTGLKSLRKYLKTPLGYLETVSEYGEKPTRIGVFNKAGMKGASDVEAAIESREASTDFAVRGAETKSLSALYTFLNARAQTTRKLFKTATASPADFAKFSLKGLAYAGIPSLVLYAINRDDPDYWKRDQMERDLYWFLPIDIKGRQVKIPKGEVGLIFGTGVEKILQALDEKAETRPKVTSFLQEVLQNVSPVGNWGETLPTFARPIAEWVNNKSYYYKTPLESEADKSVANYMRFKPSTSETLKTIGKAAGVFNSGDGVSPIKLENTLRGYTGGVGRHSLKLVDAALAALSKVQNPTADPAINAVWENTIGKFNSSARPEDPMNIPGLAGFVSRRAVGFESEPAKVFYQTADAVEHTRRTLERLLQSGSERSPEVLAWMRSHESEMNLLKLSQVKDKEGNTVDLFNQAKTQLANWRKVQNSIADNRTLDAKQKREALDAIDKKVSAIVEPIWKLVNAVSSRGKD
jgi:hypothetical protein